MKLQISSIKQKIHNFFFKISPILKFTIKEESMFPVLKPGDVVLVNKLSTPGVGDVIVLQNPEDQKMFLIKRVKEIKDEKYFVVGDNHKKSRDSRHFGTIKKEKIIGRVFHISNK